MSMNGADLAALRRAVASLEHPGLAARLANLVGRPIELIGKALPESASQAIAAATAKGLQAALRVATAAPQKRMARVREMVTRASAWRDYRFGREPLQPSFPFS